MRIIWLWGVPSPLFHVSFIFLSGVPVPEVWRPTSCLYLLFWVCGCPPPYTQVATLSFSVFFSPSRCKELGAGTWPTGSEPQWAGNSLGAESSAGEGFEPSLGRTEEWGSQESEPGNRPASPKLNLGNQLKDSKGHWAAEGSYSRVPNSPHFSLRQGGERGAPQIPPGRKEYGASFNSSPILTRTNSV